MEKEKIREYSHEEIETIAHNTASIDRLVHHTKEEAENTIGLTWQNLSKIFFDTTETVGQINTLKDKLEEHEYMAILEEENGEMCLTVKSTYELFERLK